MKNKASTFLKQVLAAIVAAMKAKSTAVRAKTSAVRTRLLVFRLLHNKKLLMSAISSKIHSIMDKNKNHGEGDCDGHDGSKKAVVLRSMPSFLMEREGSEQYSLFSNMAAGAGAGDEDEDEDDKIVNASGSVIELVRGETEGGGGVFRLEDEIDHVADVFIRRFHKQMKLQKLESFKRFYELERNGNAE